MIFWKRKIVVTYGGITITAPKIEINLKFEADATPTNGTVSIYNLSRDTERDIDEAGNDIVIDAGYEQQISTILTGSVQRIEKLREGLHRIIKLNVTSQSIAKKRLSGMTVNSWPPGTQRRVIVSDIVKQDLKMRHGPLDLLDSPPRGTSVVENGFNWSQSSMGALKLLIINVGLTFYEDSDGVFQINKPGVKSEVANEVMLSDRNGLLESPAVTEEGVRIKSLLNPSFKVGTTVGLTSEYVNGSYKVVSVLHKGDNWDGGMFTTELDCRPV